jgi:hypothetical protein
MDRLLERFTLAQAQGMSRTAFLRGTIAWLVATWLSRLILRRRSMQSGSELRRASRIGGLIGLLALTFYTADLLIEAPVSGRGEFVGVVIASTVAAGVAGFTAGYWCLESRNKPPEGKAVVPGPSTGRENEKTM